MEGRPQQNAAGANQRIPVQEFAARYQTKKEVYDLDLQIAAKEREMELMEDNHRVEIRVSYFNILIAIVGNTYGKVYEQADIFTYSYQAGLNRETRLIFKALNLLQLRDCLILSSSVD